MKGKLYAALAALTAAPAMLLAQESSSSIGPVTTTGSGWSADYTVAQQVENVDNVASGLQSMFGNIMGTIVPVVGAVILAGVAIWAMPRIVGIIKSGFQSGKGR